MNLSKNMKQGSEIVKRNSYGWNSYPGRNLSPQKLSSIIRELDAGSCSSAMELFDEMEEKDIHLSTVMQTRILAVASRKRVIIPASNDKQAKRDADFISDIWNSLNQKAEMMHNILSSIGRGFSISEMIMEVVEGSLIVKKILPCPQSLFTFYDQKKPSELLDFPLYLPHGESQGQELPRDKFIFHTHCSSNGSPLRSGLYRGLAWYYLFTNYSIKDWMSFMDLYGVPMRLGKFKPSADEQSRITLKNAVQNLGSDAAAVISEDTTIEFIESNLSGSNNLFQNAVEFFNAQKSKRVLGQTLTTDQGKSGSYSLGNVHDRVRLDIIQYDAKALDETLTRDLIIPLIKANFGERKVYPSFKTEFEDARLSGNQLEKLLKLKSAGIPLPASEFYKAAGINEPSPSAPNIIGGAGK